MRFIARAGEGVMMALRLLVAAALDNWPAD
jgi:hypothetical protein